MYKEDRDKRRVLMSYSGLIGYYAGQQAGNSANLVQALTEEWTGAVNMLLRYWESPPVQ